MKTTFKTKDLSEATALLTLGSKIVGTEKVDKTIWFIFEDEPKSQEIVKEFWFGECLVNARSYHDSLNKLKTLIFKK